MADILTKEYRRFSAGSDFFILFTFYIAFTFEQMTTFERECHAMH